MCVCASPLSSKNNKKHQKHQKHQPGWTSRVAVCRRYLTEIAMSGKTSADRLLDLYENEWNGDIDKIYKKLTY